MLVDLRDSLLLDPTQYEKSVVILMQGTKEEPATLMMQGGEVGVFVPPDAEGGDGLYMWRFDKRMIGILRVPIAEPFPMGCIEVGTTREQQGLLGFPVRMSLSCTRSDLLWHLSSAFTVLARKSDPMFGSATRVVLSDYDPENCAVVTIPIEE